MNKRSIIIILISIALVVITVLKLLSNKAKAAEKIYIHDMEAAVLVDAVNPSQHTFENAFSYLGTFEPYRQNMIGSDASGKVIKISVEEGDRVSQGQVLAKVDDELLQLQLESAEVNIEGQKKDDERYTNLENSNAIPGVQIEKTRLGLKAAEIQRKQIQKQLKSTNLTAPFSGIITKKMIDLGSVIGPGSPLVEITDIKTLKLTVSVPERDVLKFRTGQIVPVKVDVLGDKTFEGKVSHVAIQADRSHNFKVQITVKNSDEMIRAGMYGNASLENTNSITALSVPRKALVGSSKKPQVYVIRNGKAVLTSFTSGTSDGEFIEIVDGLNPSDLIVIKGQVNLENNANVKTTK
ncbi:MAG: efflux RND transporter periplasmic adaptor subunit [Bacteroidota bacterium]